MSYKQLLVYQTAWQYRKYTKKLHKINTYSVSKNISEASQSREIKYHKTWEHTGHFMMTWQWLIGLY